MDQPAAGGEAGHGHSHGLAASKFDREIFMQEIVSLRVKHGMFSDLKSDAFVAFQGRNWQWRRRRPIIVDLYDHKEAILLLGSGWGEFQSPPGAFLVVAACLSGRIVFSVDHVLGSTSPHDLDRVISRGRLKNSRIHASAP